MMSNWSRLHRRIQVEGPLRVLSYYFFAVGLEKIGIDFSHSFAFAVSALPNTDMPDVSFSICHTLDQFSEQDRETVRAYGGDAYLQNYEGGFERGEKCVVAKWRTELACVCWLRTMKNPFDSDRSPCWVIQWCFTVPAHRGKGIYPLALAYAANYLLQQTPKPLPILIECNQFNHSSTRGIRKAGFLPVGRTISLFGRKWHWPTARCNLRGQSHSSS